MRVYCEAWGTQCQVEFLPDGAVRWVGSLVKGRRGAADSYRTLPQSKALAQEAVKVAKAQRQSQLS